MVKSKGKLVMVKASNNEWYFRCVASNGKCLAVSETYSTKFNCKRSMLAFEKYVWNITEGVVE